QSDKLYKLEEKLACTACYKTYYEALDPKDPEVRNIMKQDLVEEPLSDANFVIFRNPDQKYII
ncbi:6189_t:CDS:1, partial [Racocetra persica]